jgi:hypothetical protein
MIGMWLLLVFPTRVKVTNVRTSTAPETASSSHTTAAYGLGADNVSIPPTTTPHPTTLTANPLHILVEQHDVLWSRFFVTTSSFPHTHTSARTAHQLQLHLFQERCVRRVYFQTTQDGKKPAELSSAPRACPKFLPYTIIHACTCHFGGSGHCRTIRSPRFFARSTSNQRRRAHPAQRLHGGGGLLPHNRWWIREWHDGQEEIHCKRARLCAAMRCKRQVRNDRVRFQKTDVRDALLGHAKLCTVRRCHQLFSTGSDPRRSC